MLEGRLYQMDVSQEPAGLAFRKSRPLLIGNILIVLGADIATLSLFLNEELEYAMFIGAMVLGSSIALIGIVLKGLAIYKIHQEVLGPS